MILQVNGSEKRQNQYKDQQESLRRGQGLWQSLKMQVLQQESSSLSLIQYQFYTVSKPKMYGGDSSPRTQERTQESNPYLNMPKYKQILFAKKFYSCQCGYSKRLTFQSIQRHAKKAHNILIDDSDDNYVVQYANSKQYYTYFLNPRPKRQRPSKKPKDNQQPNKKNRNQPPRQQMQSGESKIAVKEEQECKEQNIEPAEYKAINAYFSFRFLVHSYVKELSQAGEESGDDHSDLTVMKDLNNYILSIKKLLTNNPNLPNDLTYYFNDFMSRALFKREEGSQMDLAKAAKYVEALEKFWKRLRKNRKTQLELVLNNKFFGVKEEHFD